MATSIRCNLTAAGIRTISLTFRSIVFFCAAVMTPASKRHCAFVLINRADGRSTIGKIRFRSRFIAATAGAKDGSNARPIRLHTWHFHRYLWWPIGRRVWGKSRPAKGGLAFGHSCQRRLPRSPRAAPRSQSLGVYFDRRSKASNSRPVSHSEGTVKYIPRHLAPGNTRNEPGMSWFLEG